ncbi:uncharacterized protein LOC135145834 [Zophobas morio]|uniref:uncharacterized protein LOC135145834 n=1 Tax=Zophobas morio TaxID=2755281 RepID=UPI003083BB9E
MGNFSYDKYVFCKGPHVDLLNKYIVSKLLDNWATAEESYFPSSLRFYFFVHVLVFFHHFNNFFDQQFVELMNSALTKAIEKLKVVKEERRYVDLQSTLFIINSAFAFLKNFCALEKKCITSIEVMEPLLKNSDFCTLVFEDLCTFCFQIITCSTDKNGGSNCTESEEPRYLKVTKADELELACVPQDDKKTSEVGILHEISRLCYKLLFNIRHMSNENCNDNKIKVFIETSLEKELQLQPYFVSRRLFVWKKDFATMKPLLAY